MKNPFRRRPLPAWPVEEGCGRWVQWVNARPKPWLDGEAKAGYRCNASSYRWWRRPEYPVNEVTR